MSPTPDLSNKFVSLGGGGSAAHSTDALHLPALAVWGNLVIYVGAWALLMWPQHLPLGRPGIAFVFAMLSCGLRALCSVTWPAERYPVVDVFGKVEITPLALLFGLMLVNAYVKDTGLWSQVERVLDSPSPRLMLVKIVFCSAGVSAILLNDTACFVLTPIVLNLCTRRKAHSALPYLLALSTSANIGSSLTTIGNPQNALIAAICPSITFVGFARAMAGPVCVGLALNTTALLLRYRGVLTFDEDVEARPQVASGSSLAVSWIGGALLRAAGHSFGSFRPSASTCTRSRGRLRGVPLAGRFEDSHPLFPLPPRCMLGRLEGWGARLAACGREPCDRVGRAGRPQPHRVLMRIGRSEGREELWPHARCRYGFSAGASSPESACATPPSRRRIRSRCTERAIVPLWSRCAAGCAAGVCGTRHGLA